MQHSIKDLWLYPFPEIDVVHTQKPLLPEPELTTSGRCICCRQNVRYRFRLDQSWSLKQLTDTINHTHVRLHKATEHLNKLFRRGEPVATGEQEKHKIAVKAAKRALDQARLSARRLALRHVQKAEITSTDQLSEKELELFREDGPPYSLCAFCHAWHSLNGYAAAQGVMVWLPDLHPSTVVALNRLSLQEIFSNDKFRVRRGREALSALIQNRLAVEDKFRSFRPADFADVFRRYPPSGRSPLREKMNGIALILTPDSFIKKEYVD
ncbi:conjugal transfer protein TraT [Escherichia coli]|nr:conjugal transfer protein TraT [Escherichia coli]